jgi:hypothetical protein
MAGMKSTKIIIGRLIGLIAVELSDATIGY